MVREARVVAVGYPHHITQRGNYQQDIFLADEDRRTYLARVQEESAKYKLNILAYCLMTNHVHFICIPQAEDSLAQTFKYVNMKYSQYLNRKIGAGGHLFQGRFYSCVMDETHLYRCVRYIERNPVRAKMVKKAWDYQWSSARVHCGMEESDVLKTRALFRYIEGDEKGWKEYIAEKDNPTDIKLIKQNTMRGSVMGELKFITKLEKKMNRPLCVREKGRPQKAK
jgi:putative transposase